MYDPVPTHRTGPDGAAEAVGSADKPAPVEEGPAALDPLHAGLNRRVAGINPQTGRRISTAG